MRFSFAARCPLVHAAAMHAAQPLMLLPALLLIRYCLLRHFRCHYRHAIITPAIIALSFRWPL